MELIKRKIESKIIEKTDKKPENLLFDVSVVNGNRICCRWHNKTDNKTDILVNFTPSETERIKRAVKSCDF